VHGTEAQVRWSLAWAISAVVSSWCEHDAEPSERFCTVAARALFFSDLPTGVWDDQTPARLQQFADRFAGGHVADRSAI
jgi:hypothetical protein